MKLQGTLIFAYQLKPCWGNQKPPAANTYPMEDKPFTPAVPGAQIVLCLSVWRSTTFRIHESAQTMCHASYWLIPSSTAKNILRTQKKNPKNSHPSSKQVKKMLFMLCPGNQNSAQDVLLASVSLLANLWQLFLPLFSQLLCRKQTVIIWSWCYLAIWRLMSAIYFWISQRYTPLSCHLSLDCRWKQYFPKKNIQSKKFFTYSGR